jgi:hypothetical protein
MATTERAALDDIDRARRELAAQPRARKEIIEAFWANALRDAVDEAKAAESVDALRQWTEISGTVIALLRASEPGVVRRLLTTLEDAIDDASADEPSDEALEHWGRLQVQATFERVRESSLTVGWLEDHGVSRQRLNQWRSRGRLIGVPDIPGVKGFAYPRWQFTDGLRPKPWVADVLEAADESRLDALSLHLFMTNPDAGDGRSPLEAAESGDVDTAVRLVAAANAQGS